MHTISTGYISPATFLRVRCPVTMPSSRTEKNNCEPLGAAQVGARIIGNMGAVGVTAAGILRIRYSPDWPQLAVGGSHLRIVAASSRGIARALTSVPARLSSLRAAARR